jgi:putative endopeptidase
MKNYVNVLSAGCLLLTALVSCKDNGNTGKQKQFLETANMDSSVKPGDNFFLYVNGGWIKKAQIPPTETQLGSFLELYNRTKANLHSILDEVSKPGQAAGSIEQKVGDFYASGMDSATIEKRGYDPVKPTLQQIDAIKDAKGVMQFVAAQQLEGDGLLLGQAIGADEKNSSINIASYYQSGLGLPDRDYYFKTDPATQAIVKAYQQYMQKLFVLTGDDSVTAAKKTAAVYALEKQLAGSHRTNEDLRDPQSNYHKMAVADLDKTMPVFGWASLLPAVGIKTDSVNVGQPAYYAKVNELLQSVPVDTWKTYLRFHVLNGAANALSSDFVNARFEYSGKALNGQQQIKPRWERMVSNTDGNLGEALGQLYVKKYFTEDAKKRMEELVANLQKAFEARINKLDWMTDSTKQKAKEKLHAFLKKIGYPDKWRDYSKVTIDRGKYFENLVSCSKNEYQYQLAKVGKPVDRTEWGMTPPTINAYYNPTFNEIVFPAGILQYPFFDAAADDAVNYGGIGMVIGHEMTHGFDDQGAQYDKDGNMKNWWAKEDSIKFRAKAQQVINLYNGFTILDTVHIKGRLTTGENMADIGGIAIAYDAFKMTKQGQGQEKIDGFTPDQRFFLSFAQIWRSKIKEETQRFYATVDPHSPPIYRVNGPLMNFTPFYEAFGIKQGDKMYKPENERIKIW